MSIYATLGSIYVATGRERKQCDVANGLHTVGPLGFDDEYTEVWFQAVPPHIGHPRDYPEGDPYADFLPPVVAPDYPDEPLYPDFPFRAVFACADWTQKDGQVYSEYVEMFTGDEWETLPFHQVWSRVEESVQRHFAMNGESS